MVHKLPALVENQYNLVCIYKLSFFTAGMFQSKPYICWN